jgi:phosphatidylethanolamine/phosphatidyl-N-methylethanolamine N-methyltransferase
MGEEVKKDTIAKAYARWAPVYDLVFGPVFERARRAAITAAERAGGRILEVGVGTGLSLPYYAGGTQLIGVDLSEPMLRKAHARVGGLGLRNVEGLVVMDAQKMAFPDDSFDVIVAQLVVTTVPDPEAALDEFMRVLKPGGEIVLVSRVGADKGLRKIIEQRFTPITRLLGWRLEFPWARYARWAERQGRVEVLEHTPLAPFGHFSLIRFAKVQAVPEPGEQEDQMEARATS